MLKDRTEKEAGVPNCATRRQMRVSRLGEKRDGWGSGDLENPVERKVTPWKLEENRNLDKKKRWGGFWGVAGKTNQINRQSGERHCKGGGPPKLVRGEVPNMGGKGGEIDYATALSQKGIPLVHLHPHGFKRKRGQGGLTGEGAEKSKQIRKQRPEVLICFNLRGGQNGGGPAPNYFGAVGSGESPWVFQKHHGGKTTGLASRPKCCLEELA